MAREPEPLASIDDLLGGPVVEEVAETVRVDPVVGRNGPLAEAASWLFWSLLIAGLASAAVFVVAYAFGYTLPYLLLLSGFFALVALRRSLTALAAPRVAVGARPNLPDDPEREPPPDGLHLALVRWEKRLNWSRRDPDRYAKMVRPRLAEIADERLRQRHGITRASDPKRAREIMGEHRWTFLIAPPARTPNPRELAAVVKDMEKL
jgi:hypothetical protein